MPLIIVRPGTKEDQGPTQRGRTRKMGLEISRPWPQPKNARQRGMRGMQACSGVVMLVDLWSVG